MILLSQCSLRVVKEKPSGNGLICRYVRSKLTNYHKLRMFDVQIFHAINFHVKKFSDNDPLPHYR